MAAQPRTWSGCSRGIATNSAGHKFVSLQKSNMRNYTLSLSVRILGWLMITQLSAMLLFVTHRQNLLSAVSIASLSKVVSPRCILQSFFRGHLETLSLLMLHSPPPQRCISSLRIVAVYNKTFLTAFLRICQDKALWYYIDLYFLQKGSSGIRSFVCSSALV